MERLKQQGGIEITHVSTGEPHSPDRTDERSSRSLVAHYRFGLAL